MFDIGAIVKGMNSSWMSGGEHVEELGVVVVDESDVCVDPPAVPEGLAAFLAERKGRRGREVRAGAGAPAPRVCARRGGRTNANFLQLSSVVPSRPLSFSLLRLSYAWNVPSSLA